MGRRIRRAAGTLRGHEDYVSDVSFEPAMGNVLASCGGDKTVKLWKVASGRLLRSLEGHTGPVECVAFSRFHGLLATIGDETVRLWLHETGACAATITEERYSPPMRGLSFHPNLPLLASAGSDPGMGSDSVIHFYELDLAVLLGQPAAPAVSYSSAKVVLVGDSGVGKTGLGWRLAHGDFKEHSSTHGQQFWLLNQLRKERRDGAQCEAILWDLAGQADYRLIHALFLDDADLALVLFDPTRHDEPLGGVEYWLKQLKVGRQDAAGASIVLVAARCDRGSPRLTEEELKAFCDNAGSKSICPPVRKWARASTI